MPYVIVKSAYQLGQTIDATLRDLGVADRRSDVPVKVMILERTLMIDGEPCAIISTVGKNDTTTFLVDAGRKSIANRARRRRLAKASELLGQLTCVFDGAGARRQSDRDRVFRGFTRPPRSGRELA